MEIRLCALQLQLSVSDEIQVECYVFLNDCDETCILYDETYIGTENKYFLLKFCINLSSWCLVFTEWYATHASVREIVGLQSVNVKCIFLEYEWKT